MIKTIVDEADEEERKLNELRARISGKPYEGDEQRRSERREKAFASSVEVAISERLEEIEQQKFNRAMDAWLTKTKDQCRGQIFEYLAVIIFFCAITFFVWYHFLRKP